ncbi:hypothetical protein PHIM7_195 [Sinorhizobium phage phiM7]|uniref:Phospholipase n=2 Tax=Emdodecavirus TaxID=1980937 RepID=A0A0F6WCS3_9CAUD|nr:PAAR motif of membran proteins [Sinorhizobium phage phiN3]YP_009601320.1 PAAR motif of membran proteins [Sinorhizobium phage phiM7]AKF12740.1 hypothetical protein PHIM7_195 [Sinorhizobium phage phiM7]AKF13100.1 hypothetical protein PHIM19_195 [Sinorhizobium phage phiM19]AKF13470.1 phospholipase [Sinorhizobium phage phiN3]
MPEAARKDQQDDVHSPDGTGDCCGDPTTQKTDEGSNNVFVNGFGVVREGDKMITHNSDDGGCCVPHAPVLTTFSSSVYINGKRAGRKGDMYEDHEIITGSTSVFIGG